MNPDRALHFLADLHRSGWTIILGQVYICATHNTWGVAQGRGDDFAGMLDNLRESLKARELCE